MTDLARFHVVRLKPYAPVFVIGVSLLGLGCNPALPFIVDAKGFDGSYLPGSTGSEDRIGQIKIANSANDPNMDLGVFYHLTVPAELLDKYDFRVNGQSINGQFFELNGGAWRITASLPENQTACIEAYLKMEPVADRCDEIEIEFYKPNANGVGNRTISRVMRQLKLTVFDDDLFDSSGAVPNQLSGPTFAATVIDNLMGLPVLTEIPGSATAQGTQLPEPTTQMFAAGYAWTTLGTSKAFPDFPCGAGTYAWTICPLGGSDLPEPAGVGYGFFTIVVTENIPLTDPTNSYVYSVVFDSDGVAANNWVASPDFPNDFFQGTDRWYEVSYDPTNGWALICSQVTDGASQSVTRDVPTAANAMIVDNALTLVIPDSEYMPTAAQPSLRYTAFRHSGDFGLNPPYDYSADVEPPVDEPLYVVQ